MLWELILKNSEESEIQNISDRANMAQDQINPHLKEPSTSEGWVSKSSKLMQLGEITSALESGEGIVYG